MICDSVQLMKEAIKAAELGRWHTAPNPVVGAVLAKDGHIVATGWHAQYGGDHAEVACLKDAATKGIDPAGCTMAVTLEPCSHYGKTPPCTEALIAAGLAKVIVGTEDVNPEATGGILALKQAGIDVEVGVLRQECRDLIADFIVWQTTERPYVILKMAATLDGKIATRNGASQCITNEASRHRVMVLREGIATAGGAVLIGGNTLLLDNPLLTARTDTAKRHPLAAVALSRLPSGETPINVICERAGDCVFFSSAAQAASPNAQTLRGKGARIYGLDRNPYGTGLDLNQLLTCLRTEEQCHYVLCEGGAKMALSLLEAGLVDEFLLHLAPMVMGDEEAKPLFAGRSVDNIEDLIAMRLVDLETVEGDVHLRFRPQVRG